MTAATMVATPKAQEKRRETSKIFEKKHLFMHFRDRSAQNLAQRFVVAFGGMVHTFLDPEVVNYVLTDVNTQEWHKGEDPILTRAIKHRIKPMAYENLLKFASHYLESLSYSDGEDCCMPQASELQAPYVKFENANDRYAPTARELPEWPTINLDKINCGESIFSIGQRPNSTTTIQPITPRNTNCTNTRQSSTQLQNQNPRQRRHIGSRHCELCGEKFDKVGQIDEHIASPGHLAKIAETNWKDVENVIATLPSIESFATPRNAKSSNDDEDCRESFLCLTPIETIDDLFRIAAK